MLRALPLLMILADAASAQTGAPYAGEDANAIAGLSPERIEGLRAGAGLGYARAAELNGWPGPAHVLELAETLELDAATRAKVEAIRQEMLDTVRPLGEALITAEAALDSLFENDPSPGRIGEATAEIGRIEGALRAAHLSAHLATAPLLSRHQRMIYARERGYDFDHSGHGSGHGH